MGLSTPAGGALELSELRLYEGGALADTGATLTSTLPPTSGTLADLYDGSAVGIVSWSRDKYSAPGFALVWDFGVGGGVESPVMRIGSGSSAASFLSSCIMQSSTDGINWAAFENVANILYPGGNSITALVDGDVDPYWGQVGICISANGANGSTTIVDDTGRHTMTATGGAQLSTAQYKSGGSSLYLPNSGGIYTGSSSDFNFGSSDFTADCWVYPLSATGGKNLYGSYYQALMGGSQIGSSSNANFSMSLRNLQPSCALFRGMTNPGAVESATALSLNQWSHVEYARSGGTVYLFVNGTLAASTSVSGATDDSTRNFAVGMDSTGDSTMYGYIDLARTIKGVCRHTSSFTPGAPPRYVPSSLPEESPRVPRFGGVSNLPDLFVPSVTLTDGAAIGHLREYIFFDAYNGGIGTIVGTVKEKNTPANTPLHRRVLLVDEASRIVIRETWSDPITGAFEFRGVKQGVKYSTISYDHLHNYRAVIADNQDAA